MSSQGAALQAQPIYQADGNMAVCLCSQFLDPYPSPQAHWRSAPPHSALAHYCRVCNTQLNSCKQARIHVTGKKHEKRLAYLKFSLDTASEPPPAPGPHYSQQYLHPGQQQQHPILAQGLPTVYAYPPPCPYQSQGPAYYYPGPPVQHYPTYPAPYHEYQTGSSAASAPPGPSPTTSQHPQGGRSTHRRREAGGPGGQGQAPHGVMSPSLTSGFSGSGDCKSTEIGRAHV